MNSPFHRWLLRHRPLCELCTGPYPSTRIGQFNGKDTAMCDAHWRANHPIEAGYEQQMNFSRPAFSSKDDGDNRAMAATAGEGTAPKLGSGKCAGSTSASNSRVRCDVTAGETATKTTNKTQI